MTPSTLLPFVMFHLRAASGGSVPRGRAYSTADTKIERRIADSYESERAIAWKQAGTLVAAMAGAGFTSSRAGRAIERA